MEEKSFSINFPKPKQPKPTQTVFTKNLCQGMGLWTSICCLFAHLFGTKAKRLESKRNAILNAAIRTVTSFAERQGYDVQDVNVTWPDLLSVCVVAVCTLKNEQNSSESSQ